MEEFREYQSGCARISSDGRPPSSNALRAKDHGRQVFRRSKLNDRVDTGGFEPTTSGLEPRMRSDKTTTARLLRGSSGDRSGETRRWLRGLDLNQRHPALSANALRQNNDSPTASGLIRG